MVKFILSMKNFFIQKIYFHCNERGWVGRRWRAMVATSYGVGIACQEKGNKKDGVISQNEEEKG